MRKILMLGFLLPFLLLGRDIVVDYSRKGAGDGSTEKPFPRFALAARIAKPGDRILILLSDKPIRDNISVKDLAGTQEQPIVIDGSHNIFLGSKPLVRSQWEEVSPGLWKRSMKTGTNMVARYYMIWNGRINRMGRFSKGVGSASLVADEKLLKPGEWTILDRSGLPPKDKTRFRDFDFFFRLPEGVSFEEARLEEPDFRLVDGVSARGACAYVTFRNIIVKNFFNDGFNIHGQCHHLLYENVAALYCGDDGVSAHEACEIRMKNYAAVGCSTGICHITNARCVHENVYMEKIAGRELSLHNNTANAVIRGAIRLTSSEGCLVKNSPNERQECELRNLAIRQEEGAGRKAAFVFNCRGKLELKAEGVRLENVTSGNAAKQPGFQSVPAGSLDAEIEKLRKEILLDACKVPENEIY